jgi:two-component system sensor histidine kinase KdpD
LLGIGLLISELTSRLKTQLRAAQLRERRTTQLHEMTLELNEQVGVDGLICRAGEFISSTLGCDVLIYCYERECLVSRFGERDLESTDPDFKHIVAWSARHATPTGVGTEHFFTSNIYCAPMTGADGILGVIAAQYTDGTPIINPEDRRMLATCANLLALSIERDHSRSEAHAAQVQVHSEQLRNALLSSVSHDLRTPLATISVGASSVLQADVDCLDDSQRENLQIVVDESARLSRQVDNLLEMAQVNSGTLVVTRDWHVLEELVGIAIAQLRRELKLFKLEVKIPADLPLLWVADDLIVKVFVNILENATRYCPAHSRIDIVGVAGDTEIVVQFADDGAGLPAGYEEIVFKRFIRGPSAVADGNRGIGLGLAICRSIVELHGGRIVCSNRDEGGAIFEVILPRVSSGEPPSDVEETANE